MILEPPIELGNTSPVTAPLSEASPARSLMASPASQNGSNRSSTEAGKGMKLKQAIDATNLRGSIKLAASFRTLRDMKGDDVALVKESALRLVKPLGAGAFGTVELCEYTAGGKATKVAVKRLNADLLTSKVDFDHFISECQLLRKLRHRCAAAGRRTSY